MSATKKIFVGYTTRTVPDEWLEKLMPKFEGRKGTTDEEKIKAQIAEKEEQWKAEAAMQPYTGTFDQVVIVNWDKEETKTWKAGDRKPFGKKPSVSLSVRNYLMKEFPEAWPNETHPNYGRPQAVFIGFNPRLFIKMLGIECSLPWIGEPAPPPLWYSNSDHRDIEAAVIPSEFKSLVKWDTVIEARRHGLNEEELKKYNELFEDWTGPGMDPDQDVGIAIALAQQLGFIDD